MSDEKRVKFSIIIPVINETDRINSLIDYLLRLETDNNQEIIVVDGDSERKTIKVIQSEKVIRANSEPGRGKQMNVGVKLSTGEILIFLHADTKLPPDALKLIGQIIEGERYVGGAFELGIDSPKLSLKIIAWLTSIRSRLTRIPYGDQVFFIKKVYFESIGGFKDIPLFEDVEIMRRIKTDRKRIYIIRRKALTSSRRWEKSGTMTTTFKNQAIKLAYFFGVPPEKLARRYYRK